MEYLILEQASALGYVKPGFPTHFRVVRELKETGTPIGTIGFYLYSEKKRHAEIG